MELISRQRAYADAGLAVLTRDGMGAVSYRSVATDRGGTPHRHVCAVHKAQRLNRTCTGYCANHERALCHTKWRKRRRIVIACRSEASCVWETASPAVESDGPTSISPNTERGFATKASMATQCGTSRKDSPGCSAPPEQSQSALSASARTTPSSPTWQPFAAGRRRCPRVAPRCTASATTPRSPMPIAAC